MNEGSAIAAAARAVRLRVRRFPRVAVVLGSGLGDVLRFDGVAIPYGSIPHFPRPRVPGHNGILEVGEIAVMRGRCHYYEGHSMEDVVRPVRVLAELGVKTLILTNAAGAVNPRFRPGDLMIIDDHLNLMGTNPLRGTNLDSIGPRFPDLSDAYDPELRAVLTSAAKSARLRLRRGVYAALGGPSYETPAEIRMLRRLGADAIGMSTVPEVIAARHAGIRVAAVSCITNLGAGISRGPLSHEEVLETNRGAGKAMDRLLSEFLKRCGT